MKKVLRNFLFSALLLTSSYEALSSSYKALSSDQDYGNKIPIPSKSFVPSMSFEEKTSNNTRCKADLNFSSSTGHLNITVDGSESLKISRVFANNVYNFQEETDNIRVLKKFDNDHEGSVKLQIEFNHSADDIQHTYDLLNRMVHHYLTDNLFCDKIVKGIVSFAASPLSQKTFKKLNDEGDLDSSIALNNIIFELKNQEKRLLKSTLTSLSSKSRTQMLPKKVSPSGVNNNGKSANPTHVQKITLTDKKTNKETDKEITRKKEAEVNYKEYLELKEKEENEIGRLAMNPWSS